MSCLKIFAQHGYKVPNKSHLPNSWTIMSFCWANTALMLGKTGKYNLYMLGEYCPHVGQILPTCWANTTHMLGKYCPHVGQILSTCWADSALCWILWCVLFCTRGFISFSAPGQLTPSKYLPALKTSIVTVNFKVLKKESNQFCSIDGKDSKEGR